MADYTTFLEFLDSLNPEDRDKVIGYYLGKLPDPPPVLMKRVTVKISNLGTVEEIMERITQATGFSMDDLSAENIARQMVEERDNWLAVSALTAPHKLFLESIQPRPSSDKFEELLHLGRFVHAAANDLEIVVPDKPILYPDFLIRKGSQIFGVEHTRLIDGNARARIKIVQQFLENAHARLKESYPQFYGSVNVFFDYSEPVIGNHNFDNRKFTLSEREKVTQQIADFIYATAKNLPATKPDFIAQVSYIVNPEPRLDISLAENYISKDGFEELILKRIAAKKRRYKTYISTSAISKCWLLIVTDGVSSFSGFDLETVTFPAIGETEFDAVVLLEAFSHRLFWLKKPANHKEMNDSASEDIQDVN